MNKLTGTVDCLFGMELACSSVSVSAVVSRATLLPESEVRDAIRNRGIIALVRVIDHQVLDDGARRPRSSTSSSGEDIRGSRVTSATSSPPRRARRRHTCSGSSRSPARSTARSKPTSD
jgi:hypothetical protein